MVHVAEGAWLRDVLRHPDLVLAVRRDALAVYHRGASIFLAEFANGRIVPKTHVKYLQRSRQAYASLGDDGSFGLDPAAAIWTRYEGPQTLADMLRAATSLAGPEKLGLHALLVNSPHVVDTEIVLEGGTATAPGSSSAPDIAEPQSDPAATGNPTDERVEIAEAIETADAASTTTTEAATIADPVATRLDRLDVATLEEGQGTIRLVFHEAKHFANKELRAATSRTPPVLEQIARYEATLRRHETRLVAEYAAVCRALAELDVLRREVGGAAAPLNPLIRRVADGAALQLDPLPRLVVFGFDEDQRAGAVWTKHRARLIEALGSRRLYAVGNTRTKATAAFW
ncbi:hypothetical protein [Aureimonas leprariae]|uniref:Uncharacterized protein n=1 Tax=Plantimonas leprariae TaxID=2615207 RepID=A0A7V7PLH6_9HYPH|nr:hypothetical protein [Aureimonas leprariae]KAB0677235.1 hypothetical protein F6X38_19160 [Aureimonas leprariae]